MNCTSRVLPHLRDRAGRTALWTARGDTCSFGEFRRLTVGAQAVVHRERLGTGQCVLVLARPDPLLFATIVGLIGLGITVLFVEPWMRVRDIEHVLREARPQAFIGSRSAQLWAVRLKAAREIPRWISIRDVRGSAGFGFPYAPALPPETPATITFSSGTTGRTRGLVRSHDCLWNLHEMITDHGRTAACDEPALCIFPNLALLHLSTGRGAILGPRKWNRRALKRMGALADHTRAASLVCGPAFLDRITRLARTNETFGHLRSVAVGGAQCDCDTLEAAFETWPGVTWTHVYGGSEAEPVATVDARESVRRSRARGSFQSLYIGGPVAPLEGRVERDGLWVTGPNVAKRFGSAESDPESVRVDDDGRRWHFMGDRVRIDDGWWYHGRCRQPAEDFDLEQRVYSALGSSACFVHRDADGQRILIGERVFEQAERSAWFRSRFPEIGSFEDTTIVRDRRHHARIDRSATLARVFGRGGSA